MVARLIFYCLLYAVPFFLHAQQKYAVIVGVNDYYDAPGVKSPYSLSGCVNDGNAMKELLQNRFGFDPGNIYTLYNAEAIRKNLIGRMQTVFNKCQPGDAVVFYFSGHGVWMTNPTLESDRVKQGMSQAIVLSDLYSPGWGCLMRDESLKDIFNQYIDKKIILTTIFDCCYSGNLPELNRTPKFVDGGRQFEELTIKDLDIYLLPYIPDTSRPPGCRVDVNGVIIDSLDTDKDGVPDCRDWEIHTLPSLVVDSAGVTDPKSFDLDLAFHHIDPAETRMVTIDSIDLIPGSAIRSYNLKDALFVSNQSSIRPASRKKSGFLSISATTHIQKGLEISDISGNRHGAFTAALIAVYKTNPSTLPVAELLKKINAIMEQQLYHQSPTPHYDANRLKGNLIGIALTGFLNRTRAKCIAVRKEIVVIDQGWQTGIAKGNVLTGLAGAGKATLQVMEVYKDSSIAINKTQGIIRQGQEFELTDPFTISGPPRIRVYIPTTQMNPKEFQHFFTTKLLPLVNREDYMDYSFEGSDRCNRIINWNDPTTSRDFTIDTSNWWSPEKKLFTVFAPVPGYIAAPLKELLRKDQSIALMEDTSQTDLVLYMTYNKKSRGVNSGFLLYFRPPIRPNRFYSGSQLFSAFTVWLPSLDPQSINLQDATKKLYDIIRMKIRQNTKDWLNEYERRF